MLHQSKGGPGLLEAFALALVIVVGAYASTYFAAALVVGALS